MYSPEYNKTIEFVFHRQANINVESRRFGIIMTSQGKVSKCCEDLI